MRTSWAAYGALLLVLCSCSGSSTNDAGPGDSGADTAVEAGHDAGSDDGVVDAGMDSGGDTGCIDADSDGHGARSCGGDDCDDTDANRYPGNPERCDAAGHDEDCDPATLGPDMDGDTFVAVTCCNTQPGGGLLCGTDCDDTRATVNPTAVETCNMIDDNCNGMIDEGVRTSWYPDGDHDGYGMAGATATLACTAPAGFVASATDCDDTNAMVNPGAMEICDGIDNNCDSSIDPGCPCTLGASRQCGTMMPGGGFYPPPCHPGMQTCVPDSTMMGSSTWTACAGNVDPMAETCNMIDDNCNGMIDEGLLLTFYVDADGDGYGTATTTLACSMPSGYASVSGDCNDASGAIHPGATEVCNGIDDNCNSVIDEGVMTTYYRDMDGDGYGVTSMSTTACSMPAGYVLMNGDCNDTPGAGLSQHPGLPELCNGIDDNCTGGVDELPAASDNSCLPLAMYATGATCTGGSCVTTGCAAGRADCDTLYSTGCEIDTATSTAHCGSCSMACPFACAASTCDAILSGGAGDAHTCVARATHSIVCWGNGIQGQLGDGLSATHLVPTAVPTVDMSDAVGIAGGINHTCAARGTNGASCWGENVDGQLGTGDTVGTTRSTPRAISATGTINTVAAAVVGHVGCAILSPGSVDCWGRDISFQVGDGFFSSSCPTQRASPKLTATAVPGLTDAIGIAVGTYHTCVIHTGGQVACWGSNADGQLGDGATMHTSGGVRLGCTEPLGFPAYSVPRYTTATGPGCPGPDPAGTLRFDCSFAPVNVTVMMGAPPLPLLSNAIAIAAGDVHTCAIRTGGQVVCWGDNESGQLAADPSVTLQSGSALTVSGVANATAIAAAATSTCALRSTGAVACWGTGTGGQLGNGSTAMSFTPVAVSGLTDAVAIFAGANHYCAKRSGGTLVCWGQNPSGQLGDGTMTDRSTPVPVIPPP